MRTPLTLILKDPRQVLRNNELLDKVMSKLYLKNDAALSRVLFCAPPVISKIRSGYLPVGPAILLRLMRATGYTLEYIDTFIPVKIRKEVYQ